MLIAHLTDLHLPLPAAPALRSLLNKRGLGYLSWKGKRQHRHQQSALDTLIEDLKSKAPPLTLITGDIVNIALPEEFAAAKGWMQRNFSTIEAAFVPGNHDTYVSLEWGVGIGSLAAYMTGDRFDGDASQPPQDYNDFPYARRIGDIVVVMANSSPPTPPGFATGALGDAQISRIGKMLKKFGEEGCFRILALHHPAVKGAVSPRKALSDRNHLERCLNEAGAEMVVHGHMHRPVAMRLEGGGRTIPVIGAGSASHGDAHGEYRPAQYNLYEIERNKNGSWCATAEVRELNPETGAVHSVSQFSLTDPAVKMSVQ